MKLFVGFILSMAFNTAIAAVCPNIANGCGEFGYYASCEKIVGLMYDSPCYHDDECRMSCEYNNLIVYLEPPEGFCCLKSCE